MKNRFETFNGINHHINRSGLDQLRDFIYKKQEHMLDQSDAVRSQIQSKEELEEYNAAMGRQFIENLGGLEKTDVPLDAKITKRQDMDEFVMEQIIFTARKDVYVTATMYLPKGIALPAPAILFLCGHYEDARMSENYQMVCRTLTRAGLIVFAVDTTGQGERSNFYDAKTGEYLVSRAVPDHDACGVPAVAAGTFLERYFIMDQKRAIDYMLTRPEIDAARIGVTGNSGGGLQTISMMACDDRIAAAAPGTFLTTRREIMYTGQSQDSEQIWPAAAKYGFDHINALLLFAPRPVAILAVTSDFFPIEGTQEAFEEAKRFYRMYEKEDNIRMYTDEYWHYYTPKLAVCAAEFFTEVFYGEKKTVEPADYAIYSHTFMNATVTGNIQGEIPGAKTMLDEIRIHAEGQRKLRQQLSGQERRETARAWLTERVMTDRTPMEFRLRKEIIEQEEGYIGTGISWWTQPRLYSFGTLIKAEKYRQEKSLPTVVALWNDGTKKISDHREWIIKQCDSGKQVLVLDVPGTGNLSQNTIWPLNGYKEEYGTLYRLCCDLMYMGDSMAAMHCYDVLRTIEMLEKEFGVALEDITLYCEGAEGVYGILAGFLNEKVQMEYSSDLLTNVEKQILGQNPPRYENTLSYLIPGMLQFFDYDEIMRE